MQIKHGIVTEINAAAVTAKVTFADEDNLVSYDLPVVHHAMGAAKYYSMPAIGMTAICAFLTDTGIEDGFIMGSFYNEKVKPPKTGKAHYVAFEDGALVEYDEDSKTMTLKSGGGGIVLDDNVTISKDLVVNNGIAAGAGGGDMTIQGSVNATGDVSASGISLTGHTHSGVQSGNSSTGGPQ